MLLTSRIIVVLAVVLLITGPIGWFFGEGSNPAEGLRLLMISTPLLYSANLTWKVLKPQKLGIIKFAIAHALPIVMAFLGLIFVFASKAIPEFIFFGILLVLFAGILIYQMYRQKKVLLSI